MLVLSSGQSIALKGISEQDLHIYILESWKMIHHSQVTISLGAHQQVNG
jgi:hypothetical protein